MLTAKTAGCYTEVVCLSSGTSPLGHNQLAVIQRWSAYTVEPVYRVTLGTQPVGCYTEVSTYTVEPVYSGHPWDTTSWLLYRGGLLIQWNLYPWDTTSWLSYRGGLSYTVEPVYSGHPWDTTSWLLYRGGLLIQWNLYIVVTLGTQPVGCHTEVVCLYSGTCI